MTETLIYGDKVAACNSQGELAQALASKASLCPYFCQLLTEVVESLGYVVTKDHERDYLLSLAEEAAYFDDFQGLASKTGYNTASFNWKLKQAWYGQQVDR